MTHGVPGAAIVSIIGTVFFLAAFGALNLGWLKSTSYTYQIANILGALCFTYTALAPFNIGLFITEAAWALIGLYGLYNILKIAKSRKTSTVKTDLPK